MSPLGPEARAILDAAEGVDSPAPEDKERMRARLAAAIGASVVGAAATGVAVKGTTVTALSKGAGGVAGSALLAKILAAVLVVGAATAGYVIGRRADADAVRATPPEPSSVVASGAAQPVAEPTPVVTDPSSADSPTAPGAAAPPVAIRAPASTAAARPGSAPLAATASVVGSAAPAPPHSAPVAAGETEGEASLLQRARAAIDAGDGVTALDALDAHERRFPSGFLADQRQAERVVAMCTIAKVRETRESAEHFLAQRPRSQQADRIRRACGLP